MTQVPDAFKTYRQFILWRPEPGGNGKVNKKPLNYQTLIPHDPHDPAVWLDYETADSLASLYSLGLGFVFTDKDPFWYLDIDSAYNGNGWSPLATALCGQFSGCAVEISQSGRGIHIFGSGAVPPHRCKDTAANIELYTSRRFVALTGTHLTGDAGHRPPIAALQDLVSSHFPPDAAGTEAPTEWTDGPRSDWSGPVDDGDLLIKMLASKSAGAVFGNRATVQALWTGETELLAAAFPPQSHGQDFDHSSADAALCMHLAFWSGCDCSRMDRLFRMSALYRDKWDREDYRRRTILGAVGRCKDVYGGGKSPTITPSNGQSQELKTGFQYLTISQQMEYFRGCVYVRDLHRVLTPDGALLKQEQFKAMYGGYVLALDDAGAKTTRNAWEAFTESQGARFPKVFGACFRPELPAGQIVQEGNESMVNIYVPASIDRKEGDPAPFLTHLEKLLPNKTDRIILLSYLAACVQYPGIKFQWCPLIQGCEGNGKTLLANCVAHAVGWKYTHFPNANDITNKFNSWILGKLLIVIEEIYVSDRQEAIECLKPMITNLKIEIQGKGRDQIITDNRANFIINTNHKDGIRKSHTDRRYCILYTAQQTRADIVKDGMGGNYFPRLYDWLRGGGYAIVAHFLNSFTIPEEYNPAAGCHRAPDTTSTREALRLSLGGLEQEIFEAIDEGRYGFSGGWVSSLAFNMLIKERKDEKRIPPNKRRQILENLGYVLHPGLPEGRVNSMVIKEAGKPRLFIRQGHPAINLTVPADIAAAYSREQDTPS